MKLLSKGLLMGLGAGAALTLMVLNAWGGRYQRELYFATMPPLLRPFVQPPRVRIPESSARLPKPWLPETSGRLHDVWQIRSLDGKTVQLAAFKGKVVFLNFWATYCTPCIEEMPGIERLYDSLRNQDVTFLAVTQEKEERVRQFLSKNHLSVPVYLADQELPSGLPVSGIPVTYILDRNGKAVFRSVGAANWDDDGVRSFIRGLESQQLSTGRREREPQAFSQALTGTSPGFLGR